MPVTLILTLKGRYLHTLRWMWHANAMQMPHRVIIADGELQSPIANIIKNKTLFPNLNYEYRCYNDNNLRDYIAKSLDVLSDVPSNHCVMMADNDDYIFSGYLSGADHFLGNNQDYSSCYGVVGRFIAHPGNSRKTVRDDPTGNIYDVSGFKIDDDLYDDQAESDRLLAGFKYIRAHWYNVFRRDVIVNIFTEILESGMVHIETFEYFLDIKSMICGKVKFLPMLSLMRQEGTSSCGQYLPSAMERIFFDNLMGDIENLIAVITRTGPQGELLANIVRRGLMQRLSAAIGRDLRADGAVARRHPLLRWLGRRPLLQKARVAWRMNALRPALERLGGDFESGRAEFMSFAETMRSPDFRYFLSVNAPHLVETP